MTGSPPDLTRVHDGGMGDEEIQLDVIDFGQAKDDSRPRRRWPGWLLLVLAAGLVGVLVAQNAFRTTPSAAPTTAAPAATRPVAGPGPSTPAVTDLGHPLLGVRAGWELLALSTSGVIRIELAHGRITRTAVPPLQSTGPVFFLAGRGWTMVRPLDHVPGYLVPDGQPAQSLTGPLESGGAVLPGPDLGHVWVAPPGSGPPATMALVGVDGIGTGVSIRIPNGIEGILPDGAGYLILTGPGGAYAARPEGLRRVTGGRLLAVGPTRWLTLECDELFRCSFVVVDRATGATRVLGSGAALPGPVPSPLPGPISPDGVFAALAENDRAGGSVHLVDLASGADRRLDVPVDLGYANTAMVWSPDSRWLFVVGNTGTVVPVEAAAGQAYDLGAPLPPVTQLAVRPAPG
jgi:hypothetical protein